MSWRTMGGLGFNRREAVALAVLLAILLFLPLGVSRLALAHWGELAWRAPMDLAFLEWTGAFLQAFLFLLLIEACRHSGRWRHAWLAAAFFAMSGLNFAYALSGPGGDAANWLKLLGMGLGGGCACGCLFCGERPLSGIVGVLVRIVLPVACLMGVFIWMPFGLKQLLPALTVSGTGQMPLAWRLAVVVPAGLFFLAAMPWLRAYLRDWRREGLLFTVVLLAFAQSMLLWRDARSFGVLWWSAHLVVIAATLMATVAMLVSSIRHSVVWKLIFSLGLTFGLTVILTAGMLQGYSQRRFAETQYRQIHGRHQLFLAEQAADVRTVARNLEALGRRAAEHLAIRHGGLPADGLPAWLETMVEVDAAAWRGQLVAAGYMSVHGVSLPRDAEPLPEVVEVMLAEMALEMTLAEDGRIEWSAARPERPARRTLMLAAKPLLVRGRPAGFFFKVLDVGWLSGSGIAAGRRLDQDREGRILFDARRGRILARELPAPWVAEDGGDAQEMVRELMAAAYDAGAAGKVMVIAAKGMPYLVSACRVPETDWVAMHLLDQRMVPGESGGVTYTFAGVGMAVLLVGFVVLLLLLNAQLARPLQRLLRATERVECGDLTTRIGARDATELGVVSRSFDHMLARMEDVHGELERTIAERTAALAEASHANQAKATFFASVSHELRTPLHGVLSCSRLGSELTAAIQPKAAEYFDNINLCGRRLLKLIDEILDLAKLESGYMEFNYRQVGLLPVVRQAATELSALFAEKDIRLVYPGPEEEVTLVADVDMLRRVFVNLFGNAVKFARPGTVVAVEFQRMADSIVVSVLDEGPGIPEGEAERIFEKFFQARQGAAPGGTGIGLATCREIVTAHGGTISAVNRPEGGAAFRFVLPLAGAAARSFSPSEC